MQEFFNRCAGLSTSTGTGDHEITGNAFRARPLTDLPEGIDFAFVSEPDDLDGTVQEETIYHMAGSRAPSALSTGEIEALIVDAGRQPIERDTLYNVVRTPLVASSPAR